MEGRTGVSDMDDAQAQQTNPLFGIIPKEFFITAGIAEQTCILGLSVPGCFRQ